MPTSHTSNEALLFRAQPVNFQPQVWGQGLYNYLPPPSIMGLQVMYHPQSWQIEGYTYPLHQLIGKWKNKATEEDIAWQEEENRRAQDEEYQRYLQYRENEILEQLLESSQVWNQHLKEELEQTHRTKRLPPRMDSEKVGNKRQKPPTQDLKTRISDT
ncbi:hypothetical protein ARMGADRAFT_1037009 [Armillaria gallica]|uniref:Uncharacterized protein n=1 Tax=Armillaria gallica TaxID=47427 RepID=A0A2H3CN44_ARMGA|nr:hypothetical protein ARMGADRAFT_1037009 [Armillaria gallica]